MSSTLTIHGTLTFPAGTLERWRASPIAPPGPQDGDLGEVFAGACDEGSVADVLDCDDERWPFARFVADGDRLHIRAALGDDYWSAWCVRIAALARTAARLGARGHLEVMDDGCHTGALVVGDEAIGFDSRRPASDRAGERELYAILEEVMAAEQAAAEARAARRSAARAAKKTAKKAAAKKAGAKKTTANEQKAAKKARAAKRAT